MNIGRVRGTVGFAIAALAAHACGGKTETADTLCEPGATLSCPKGCVGQSVCLPSGTAWSECSCGSGGAYGGGSGGYGATGYGGYGAGGYGGYGAGGYGGYGAGGSGGYAASGGYGAFGGYGGGFPCDESCPSYMLGGLIEVPPCCGASGECGIFLDSSVGPLVALPVGCYPVNQSGSPSADCPPLNFTNPITAEPSQFPGCCESKNGTCGIYVDLTSAQGPDLGCIDPGMPSSQQLCIVGDCSTCVQAQCASQINLCLSQPACLDIITCTQQCGDQFCVDMCVAASPNGAFFFNGIQTCVSQHCLAECSTG